MKLQGIFNLRAVSYQMECKCNVLDMGWQPVTTASSWNKAKVSFAPIPIKEEGYMFVYLSYENESNNWVYFDDMKVTHTKSNVIQYNEYYPFGLQTNTNWTRENTYGNAYLYNEKAAS